MVNFQFALRPLSAASPCHVAHVRSVYVLYNKTESMLTLGLNYFAKAAVGLWCCLETVSVIRGVATGSCPSPLGLGLVVGFVQLGVRQ